MSQNPKSFSSLPLKADLLENLDSLGYRAPTAVQAQALPPILDGSDLIALAKTGSGKTAAFGLGLLQRLRVKDWVIQSLVLCPTRELADQVAQELRRLARGIHNVKILTLCGGVPLPPQRESLRHGAHLVVGTPGRVEDHVRRGHIDLSRLDILVLDEADRMLEMGFQESLDTIFAAITGPRQTLLFSATNPEQIQQLSAQILDQPKMVQVEEVHDDSSIRQFFYRFEQNKQRFNTLRLTLLKHRTTSSLVFCNTRLECQEVAGELRQNGFSALALHGELEQRQRDQVLVRFANRSVGVLVATDVAARGLDIDSLGLVVNYHVARDPEVHVHRVGRTGRAGARGIACTLFTDKESYKLARLGEYLGRSIEADPLPDFALLKKAPPRPDMVTLQIDGGKKQKLRPGDILGALTGKNGIAGKQVGKINIFDFCAYVAVDRSAVKPALRKLGQDKLKGRTFRVRRITGH